MVLKNMLTREIKYTRKTEKSAFREIFVARYIPILQYLLTVIVLIIVIGTSVWYYIMTHRLLAVYEPLKGSRFNLDSMQS